MVGLSAPIRPDLSGFGSFRVLEPLAGGARNAVWLVVQGERLFVAKSTRRSEAALAWAQDAMALARRAGFATPEMQTSQSGRLISAGHTLETHLPGAPLTAKDLPALQNRLTAFHRLARHMPQRPGFASASKLGRAEVGGDVDLTVMPAPLRAACQKAWAALPRGEPETVCHGDLSPSNILSGQYPALIDWDESRRDNPCFDMAAIGATTCPITLRAAMAWEIAVCWLIEPAYARSLVADFSGMGCAGT